METYFNPYRGASFFGFFLELFSRLGALLQGKLGLNDLASDEVQALVLMGVAASAALVGTLLVLRRAAMLANSLSHTILLGIVIVYIIIHQHLMVGEHTSFLDVPTMLGASVLTGIVTTFLTEFLTKTVRLQDDASNGLVFTSFFSLGIILVTLFTRNVHIGTEVVMGNVDALHVHDLHVVFVVLAANILLFSLFFRHYLLTTFDAGFARTLGISTTAFNYLLMIQVSATAIAAFRAVGVLMVLAFIVGPPLTARLLTHRLRPLLILAAAVGCIASLVGVALARHLLTVYDMPLSTGGLVVCMIVLFYILALIFAPEQGFIAQAMHRRRIRARSN